ncbi:MAG TPA: SdrD B-like domain-containing protein [Tepidisphaeraceae bacterium]|jgi:prepilin-type processing-associated H-X9-DG protein|nr:SdrD B-like domain-containing protein [Tepidisphaeraceae bacterium]
MRRLHPSNETPRCMIEAVEPRVFLAADLPALHISAGGLKITDSIGRTFVADSGFVGGQQVQSPVYDVANVTDDSLFSSYRSGSSFSYSKSIPSAHYSLWLEFAEPTFTAAGQRTFDVSVEGKKVLDNFDIIAAAGGNHIAVAKALDVNITDGQLNLSFVGENGSSASVSAIVLLPTDPSAAAAPYDYWSGSDAARMVHSASNLRAISQSMQIYANENKGKFPPNLLALVDTQDVSADYFGSPRTSTVLPRGEISQVELRGWVAARNDYIYLGAGKTTSTPATVVVAYENPNRVNGDINILWADGHVTGNTRTEASQIIGFPDAPPSDPPPTFPTRPAGDAKIVQSQLNLRALSQALLSYSLDFKLNYPAQLGTLYDFNLVKDVNTFINPRGLTQAPPSTWTKQQIVSWINASTDYLLLAKKNAQPARQLAVTETPGQFTNGFNQLLLSGLVEFREVRWANEALARYAPSLTFPAGGAISGIVFSDTNGNKVRDSGETDLAGITVYNDANNNSRLDAGERTTTTDVNGFYVLRGLAAGSYKIRQILQSGWSQTTPANNYGWTITLAANQRVTGKEFGQKQNLIPNGSSIAGAVFNDFDQNGLMAASEPGLSGIIVYNDSNNNGKLDAGERTTVTDASGNYLFTNLPAASYKIRQILQAGWFQTSPANNYGWTVSLSSGQHLTGRNFGAVQVTYPLGGNISGTIFNDLDGDGIRDPNESGVGAGWDLYIDLDNDSMLDPNELVTSTDANGNWTFWELPAGTYKIRQILHTGWKQTTPTNNYGLNVTLASNQIVRGKLFGSRQIA